MDQSKIAKSFKENDSGWEPLTITEKMYIIERSHNEYEAGSWLLSPTRLLSPAPLPNSVAGGSVRHIVAALAIIGEAIGFDYGGC